MTTDLTDKPAILVLFAHPYPHMSRVNRAMVEAVADLPRVTVHDLYETYPDFHVDIKREQAALLAHDVVVMQHPLYWYSCPSLLKEWMDAVLEYGWAYGTGGTALKGKELVQAISTGGPDTAYRAEGYNRHSIVELLRPFELSAQLCGMSYRAPFLFQGVRLKSAADVAAHARRYREWLSSYPHPKSQPACEQPAVPATDR
ncbi:MAG TPA: NAD(P)H-dependent oxidoreductase [Ferrovibrio sp.]|uniref:glutathione-regulated potassium-efflux system oxidoreductase KefF n=1 Tax=Ferrovibrio sp. TaxID=1917215 RepID=UPI002ED34113